MSQAIAVRCTKNFEVQESGKRSMSDVVYLSEQNSELLVYGYIHQGFNDNFKFPTDIIDLCLKWYYIKVDKWDLECSNTDKLDIDASSGVIILRDAISDYKTAIGSIIISKNMQEHIWRMKYIYSTIPICFFSLGLVPANVNAKESYWSVYQLGYGLHAYDGNVKQISSLSASEEKFDIVDKIFQNIVPGDVIIMKYMTIDGNDNGDIHGEIWTDEGCTGYATDELEKNIWLSLCLIDQHT